ncbi:YcaO-like family protein [Sulfidibacter corallicola]|uniref:YcaO-like family protein n=1 Tax=Sulfidibacter corallicola TaxID=2818388 RepID=A0A8A4TJX8_SULCO|nr:YcaO-like family protein [Sulfidibacter corallicola]QTD49787.1 YcaO-like family protein [Sulfidibacter corallicola]
MTTTTFEPHAMPRLDHLEIRGAGEDTCTVTTSAGDQYEVAMPAADLAALLRTCDGSHTLDDILENQEDGDALREVISALQAAEPADRGDADPCGQATILLTGEGAFFPLAQTMTSHFGTVVQVPEARLGDELERLGTDHLWVVAFFSAVDRGRMESIEETCFDAGVPWLPFHLDRGHGWLGPLVIPGSTADIRDLFGRRRCTGDEVEEALLYPAVPWSTEPGNPWPDFSNQAVAWMVALLFGELEAEIRGQTCRLLSCELEVDPKRYRTRQRPFLPLPTRVPKRFRSSCDHPREQLVGNRAGIVLDLHRVDHHPDFPSELITIRAHNADLSRIYPWGNDLFVGGSAFGNGEAAAGAALGEALERYCGNCLPGVDTVVDSYSELTAKGRHALDPGRLSLHSEAMLAEPGCPFVPFTRDLPVRWVSGHSLTHDRHTLLPLSLVYANWLDGEFADDPVTNYLYTPGMAAGQNLEQALVGAVRELVERDITMTWWLHAHPLPRVAIPSELRDRLTGPSRETDLRYGLIHLDNEFQIPVMAGVVIDEASSLVSIGFGCRPEPLAAAEKALTEALTLLEGSYDLLKPDSTLRKSAEEWGLLHVNYKPWRADRQYLDSFRPDFRDLSDLMLQPQLYLDPRALDRIRPLIETPVTRELGDLPSLPDDRFETYRERIESRGFELLYADITSPDVALTPFKVVRVLIPGLVPNMPAAFPAYGGRRLYELPVQLGWSDQPLREDQLNTFPMPHA